MSSQLSPAEELVQFTRRALEARGLIALVLAQHQLRIALRRALALREWPELERAQRDVAGSPSLLARFNESLHGVLETPELTAREFGARWHGLVLAIPVALASRAGALAFLPEPLALALRESLQARFPPGTGIRLSGRPIPQLVAHAMETQSLYELIAALAAGEGATGAVLGSESTSAFVPQGRSLGRHYFFALAVTTRPEQLALEMPGGLHAEPALIKWAAAQTEKITSDFAERGWPLLMRVSPPQRLREVLASLPVLSDVGELDGLLERITARHGTPVAMLRADLAPNRGDEPGLHITIRDREVGTALAQVRYGLAGLGAETGAYRVAVRLASAGVELAAADENLLRVVQRAIALTNEPIPADAGPPEVASRWRRRDPAEASPRGGPAARNRTGI